MKNTIKVSIIMPVLNGMPYFPDALESVVSQTLPDIEVIVVDAGSTDGTIEYIKEQKEKNDNIMLCFSEKKSTGYQYNIGLSKAVGEYVGFVESDDYVPATMYELLYNSAIRNEKPDYVKGDIIDFAEIDIEKYELYVKTFYHNKELYGKVINKLPFKEIIYRDVNHWSGIYRRDFLTNNKIVFNETLGAAAQDAGFVSQTLLLAKSRMYLSNAFYHYRQDNPGSSMKSSKRLFFTLQEYIFLLELLSTQQYDNIDGVSVVADRYFYGFMYNYVRNTIFDKYLEELLDEFTKLLKSYYIKHKSSLDTSEQMGHFLENRKSFFEDILSKYKRDKQRYEQVVKKILSSSQLLIFGAGELGEGTYVCLKYNGYKGEIAFCDNRIHGERIHGCDILSVEEASLKWKDACFIITNSKHYDNMKAQLLSLGVSENDIVYFEGVWGHSSFKDLSFF